MITDIAQLFQTGSINFDLPAGNGEQWTLSATGDYGIMPSLDRTIAEIGLETLAANMRGLIESDISITNLEVALCEEGEMQGRGVRGRREVFQQLHAVAPFTVYSIANNHLRDAGAAALSNTLDYFDAGNIAYVGGGRNTDEAEAPLLLDAKGVEVGIMAFAQNENQIADAATPGAAELTVDKVLAGAKMLVDVCDIPIVVMHEGFEFLNFPRTEFRDLCRQLVAEGVRVVIGHHSHTPQGVEMIDNSVIFFSLGNFLFSQRHFAPYPWSRASFVPVVTFSGTVITGLELRPLCIETDPVLTRPAAAEEAVTLFEHLQENSAIVNDSQRLRAEQEAFCRDILLPEFFGYIQNYGNENNGDFSKLIKRFETQITIYKLFTDVLESYLKA